MTFLLLFIVIVISRGPSYFRTVIIKTGQVMKEVLIKQIDHINKIRGDMFRLLRVLKTCVPPATTLLIVLVVCLFCQLLKGLFLSSPVMASSSDCVYVYSPTNMHCNLP